MNCIMFRQEKHIKTLQKALSKTFEKHRPELESHDNSTTFAELQHTASLVRISSTVHSLSVQCQCKQHADLRHVFVIVTVNGSS